MIGDVYGFISPSVQSSSNLATDLVANKHFKNSIMTISVTNVACKDKHV